ncbi:MAG: capsular polysaccharide synthesis protein [Acidobacteriaceae bacterium]
MAIPKIIHYCWFGKKETQPKLVRECIASWSKLDDYQIYEWNESNFDPGPSSFFAHMMATKRYGFASDIVRLTSLYRMGGIYLDSDVEVKKKFPESILLHQAFMSFMFDSILGTAVIGAEAQSPLIGKLLDHYRNLEDLQSPSNNIFTRFFLEEFPEFRLNNKFQVLRDNVAIYPKEYFDCPTYNREMGYTVHHGLGSWFRNDKSPASFLRAGTKLVLGNVIYSKLSRYRGLKVSPFYKTYQEHTRD